MITDIYFYREGDIQGYQDDVLVWNFNVFRKWVEDMWNQGRINDQTQLRIAGGIMSVRDYLEGEHRE